jgi:hypothetical protein
MQDAKRSVRFALLAAGLLVFAGCDLTGQSTNPNGGQPPAKSPVVASDDPLLNTQLPPAGLAPLPQNKAVATNTQPPATGAVPPIQQPTGTPSTAVLAGGKVPAKEPAPEGRDLRIGATPAVPATGAPTQLPTWGDGPTRSVTAPGGGSDLALTGGSGNADGFAALQTQLQQRNVVGQRLEQVGQGQWEFRCTVQSPSNPNLGALYRSQAGDPLSAIHGAIDQIDEDRSKPSTPASHP